jgi:hypothetical protein
MGGKGAEDSKVFRRAGLAWGRGDSHKAMAILEDGLALATARGDTHVVQVMQQGLEHYRRLATAMPR